PERNQRLGDPARAAPRVEDGAGGMADAPNCGRHLDRVRVALEHRVVPGAFLVSGRPLAMVLFGQVLGREKGHETLVEDREPPRAVGAYEGVGFLAERCGVVVGAAEQVEEGDRHGVMVTIGVAASANATGPTDAPASSSRDARSAKADRSGSCWRAVTASPRISPAAVPGARQVSRESRQLKAQQITMSPEAYTTTLGVSGISLSRPPSGWKTSVFGRASRSDTSG